MSTIVLGKRTRSENAQVSTRETRAKRRAVTKNVKENIIPIYQDSTESNENDDVMSIDSIEGLRTPAKTPQRGKRTVLSPTKVNAHFKATKSTTVLEVKKISSTPSTPRRRDRVQIPITPKHRVNLPGAFPRTPRTPSNKILIDGSPCGTPTTPSSRTIFTTAKSLFVRSTAPGRLVGREKERQQMFSFVNNRLERKNGGCLYVSGPPGTGKSALVNETLSEVGDTEVLKKIQINCMTMKDPKAIYSKLAEVILNEVFPSPSSIHDLEKIFMDKSSKGLFIVVLDEIDHLLTKDQDVLYKVFEWSFMPNSRLILIGIANALDLTDRFLPKLKARNFSPTLLPVLPYSAPQIAEVVTARLQTLNDKSCEPSWVPMMHPAAITLCSKKIASSTGDLRKCFDICRKAIEMVEQETKTKFASTLGTIDEKLQLPTPMSPSRKPLGESNVNQMSPTKSVPAPMNPLSTLTAQSAPRATLAHIARISAASFGISSTTRLQLLNLQQKAVITALVVLAKQTANGGTVLVRCLWDAYRSLCTRDKILAAITKAEFGDVLSSLEGCGVVEIGSNGGIAGTPSKKGRNNNNNGDDRRIRATVREEEVRTVLTGDAGDILMRFFNENL